MANNENDIEKIKWELRKGSFSYLGSGSSRRVYDMLNGYVLKVAKNKGGIEQNQVEYRIFQEEQSELFAPILFKSDDHRLLVMQKAERIWRMQYILEYYKVNSMQELVRQPYLLSICKKYDLAKGDLIRKSSWGTIQEVPLLIDYGYTVRSGRI